MNIKCLYASLIAVLFAATVNGEIRLANCLGNGMVLQRGVELTIWGFGTAGETVEASFVKTETATALPVPAKGKIKSSTKFTAVADTAGQWQITLPALKYGGPYALKINDIIVDDILIGDVLLCSGQSNMELPVARVTDMFADEIASYENTRIRQIIIPKEYNFAAPQSDIKPVEWKPLTQADVMQFSALAYFTAKALYAKTGIPVGIVNASWGGTPVEAWIDEEHLVDFPKYINEKRIYEDDDYRRNVKQLEGQAFHRWNVALYRGDAGLHEATPWFSAEYDDSEWTEIDMFSSSWATDGLNPCGGSHWLRQHVNVSAECAGQPAVLRMGCIVDSDSLYVNGTFVGSTGYQYPPRIYRLPEGLLHEGDNIITARIVSNGGKPEFIREKPYKIVFRDTEIQLSTKWLYRRGAPMPSAPSMMFFCYKPVCLYNTMIAPIAKMRFGNVVWYQGESNIDRYNEYAALLTTMITNWRETFDNQSLPFFIVELADFLAQDDPGRENWAQLRKAQADAASQTDNATLIKNSDLGEWNDIHPLDKKTLGERVAEAILSNDK